MGVVAINFVEFGSPLFEVTKNFKKNQKMMKRFLRGSSSQSSKDKKIRRIKSPSIISLAPRRFGRVNGLVMSS